MKVIIAGSRGITDLETVREAFEDSPFKWSDVNEVVSGEADGVDSIGEKLAEENNIPVETFPVDNFVDESPSKKVAPIFRNEAMAEYADALVAVWDGDSPGTEDMISQAEREDLRVSIHRTDTHGLGEFL